MLVFFVELTYIESNSAFIKNFAAHQIFSFTLNEIHLVPERQYYTLKAYFFLKISINENLQASIHKLLSVHGAFLF